MKTPAMKITTRILVLTRLVYRNRLTIERILVIKSKLFLNHSLCPYYRMLHVRVKELAKQGLIDSFWISNGTIKMKELSESQPVSITHLTDLED